MARGNQVWFNGKIIPAEDAKISLFTHALHYGTGVFEGIRAYKQTSGGGAVFRLKEHLVRMFESCKILGLEVPYSLEDLTKAALAVCQANGFDECYIRPIAFVGDGPLGVYPGSPAPVNIAILNWEWGQYLGKSGIQSGTRLKISSFIRPHVNSSMTKGKICGQYVNSVLAKQEAISNGYDEALMLDQEGYLTEGTGENLFIIKNGIIKTTPPNSILAGITRGTIMELLSTLGHQVKEIRFTRDELICADEAFLTGTAAEVTPVKEVDGKIIGPNYLVRQGKDKDLSTFCPGPITSTVLKAYSQLVRGESKALPKEWLTKIS